MAARFRTINHIIRCLPRRWEIPVYVTDVAMLVIQYAQICLPCLFAVAMVPVFCFCLPCVIRLLAALHDPQHGRGATRRDLDKLPTCPFSADLRPTEGRGAVLSGLYLRLRRK